MVLFRRLDLWTVREIGDVILGVQVLKECDEVALRMCIAAYIGVNFAVADRKSNARESIPNRSFTFDQNDVCWTIGVL